MASTVTLLAHTHSTTTRISRTRTRQTCQPPDNGDEVSGEDDDNSEYGQTSTQGSAGSWYEIKKIIGEQKHKYKVLWEGVDPKTNRPWKAEWIKKSEVTAPAVAEWEESKLANAPSKLSLSAGARPSKRKRTCANYTTGNGIKLRRIQLVVHDPEASTSEYQPTQPVADPIIDSSPAKSSHRLAHRRWVSALEEEDEIEDSFEQQQSLLLSPSTPRIVSEEPFVELSQRSITFDRAEYLRYADLPTSQPASQTTNWIRGASPNRLPTHLQPQHQGVVSARSYDIDKVIPDSQPSILSSALVSSTADSSSAAAIETGADKANHDDDSDGSDDGLLSGGAQPRSQWLGQTTALYFDYLEPLLQKHLSPRSDSHSGRPGGWEQGIVSSQDEHPLTFASQPEEFDILEESSILHPPSRSLSPYTGPRDHDIPPLSLSDCPMAEQQSLHTPPFAGSQTPSTGKPSLRERLAQARLGFNDAVSAFRSTPTRADALTGRASQSPALTPRSPTPAPQQTQSPLIKPTIQPGSLAIPGDAQTGVIYGRASPRPDKMPPPSTPNLPPQEVLQSREAAQSNSESIPVSPPQPVDFASQLRLSLSSLPEVDQNYAPSQAALTQISSYPSLPTSPKLSPGEHVVMVGLSVGQKEAYLQNINNKSRIIQKFCNRELQDEQQAEKEITELLDTARRIATHLDLATDGSLKWEKQDNGYALLHPKFQFLKAFIDAVRYQSLTIAILAEPGKTLDVLELFLKGIKVRCKRTDGFNKSPALSSNEVGGSVSILLAPTGPEGARVLGSYASLVIGLDSTFNAKDKQVDKFRAHTVEVGRYAPILRLVSVNTVEHVKLFLPSRSSIHLPQLMSYVAILRHQAGTLPAAYNDELKTVPKDIAKIIIKMSETFDSDVDDTLVTLDIPGLPIFETESRKSTQQPLLPTALQNSSLNETSNLSVSVIPLVPHIGEKRRWEETSQEVQVAGTEELPEKKRRVVNAELAPSAAPEVTHISDSQPNTAPGQENTQDQQKSMDIDQPEIEALRMNAIPVPPPAQANAEDNMLPPSSQDSVVLLAIREHGDGDISVSKDQTSGERSSDRMEGVAYDQPSLAGKASSGDQSEPVSQAPAETGSELPGALLDKTVQSNPKAENAAAAKPVIPAEKKQDSGIPQANDLNPGVIDGEVEDDDFECPAFDKPLKLPPELTLIELNAEQLRQLLYEKSREFDEWVNSTSRLQLRFEEMRQEVTALKSQLKKSKDLEVHAQERMTRLNTEVVTLKEDNKQLRQELNQARASLLSSGKPELVELETFRSENAKLKDELGNAERQIETAKSEVEYVRDAYQTATREGGDRSKEATELRRLNEELERKADERAVRLRELQIDNQSKVKDQQIDKLKHLLAEREERIRRLEYERNNIGYKGGRSIGTRATSVPRRGSPSKSRTSSPGPGTLPGNSIPPAPAGRDHPTRPYVQSATRRGNKE